MDVMLFSSIVAQSGAASPPIYWWLAPIAAIAALAAAYFFYRGVMQEEEGTDTMVKIAQAVREGAMAYLRAQYSTVIKVFIGLFVLFIILAFLGAQEWVVTVAFLTAGLFWGRRLRRDALSNQCLCTYSMGRI